MERNKSGLSLAGTAAVFLGMVMACHGLSPLTACPRKDGYTAYPDLGVQIHDDTGISYYDTLAEAEAACSADPACLHFNNYAESYTNFGIGRFASTGLCTYLKQDCKAYDGYISKPKQVNWDTSAANQTTLIVESAAFAATECASDASCLAWSFDGTSARVATGASVSDLTWMSTTTAICSYVKDPCPPKIGFFNTTNVKLVPGVGFEGVDSGNFGSGDKAEAYCKITPKCTAFTSDGDYTLGGLSTEPAVGTCAYIKHPCTPVPGFTAFDGVSNKHDGVDFPPKGRFLTTCFAEIAARCVNDKACIVFDSLRYIWNSDVIHANPYPGMCTYRKASGFFDDSDTLSRRRRALRDGVSVVAASAATVTAAAA